MNDASQLPAARAPWRAWLLVVAAMWAAFAPAWTASASFAPSTSSPPVYQAAEYEPAPSRADARGQNSHLGFFGENTLFDAPLAFANHGTASGSEAAGPETAPGVCIYLYAHANPVNNWDPSGHFTLPALTMTMAIRGILGAMAVATYYHYIGGPPARAMRAGGLANTQEQIGNTKTMIDLITIIDSGGSVRFDEMGFKVVGTLGAEMPAAIAADKNRQALRNAFESTLNYQGWSTAWGELITRIGLFQLQGIPDDDGPFMTDPKRQAVAESLLERQEAYARFLLTWQPAN